MGEGPKGDTMGRAVHIPFGTNSSTLALTGGRLKGNKLSPCLLVTLRTQADWGYQQDWKGAGGSWLATGGTNEEAKKKEPCQMQKGPQHACFPSLAHESRG